jgi:hypothetical protein
VFVYLLREILFKKYNVLGYDTIQFGSDISEECPGFIMNVEEKFLSEVEIGTFL